MSNFIPDGSALSDVINQFNHINLTDTLGNIAVATFYSFFIWMIPSSFFLFLQKAKIISYATLEKITLPLAYLGCACIPALFLAIAFNSETFSLATTIISFVALLYGPAKRFLESDSDNESNASKQQHEEKQKLGSKETSSDKDLRQ